ncbi:MAG: hypothetical protein AAGF15_11290 [Pseudomonadota bacterium]
MTIDTHLVRHMACQLIEAKGANAIYAARRALAAETGWRHDVLAAVVQMIETGAHRRGHVVNLSI